MEISEFTTLIREVGTPRTRGASNPCTICLRLTSKSKSIRNDRNQNLRNEKRPKAAKVVRSSLNEGADTFGRRDVAQAPLCHGY